jgi:hypothetical protein
MAINLTYDPSTDPEAIEAQEASDADAYAIGEQMEQEQQALLAGKYRNAEELEQAYIELQKKFGSKDQDESTDTEEQSDEDQTDEEETEDPYVDFLFDASAEYTETGTLSEETLAAFSQMSSTELVEAYMRLQQQLPESEEPAQAVELSDSQVNQIQNSVGGEAAYQQLTTWAAENFSPAEVEAFDAVIESGNMASIGLALQALYYRYTDSMGFEGNMIQGKPAQAADAFRSQAEVVRAMSDPRYDSDPAYRQDVFNKLERSNLDF